MTKTEAIQKESDLFNPVKNWLLNDMACTDVYAEVQDIDVVGVNQDCPYTIVVEMKRHFSFKLLDQATDRLNRSQYVYIAVPKGLSGTIDHFVLSYCRKMGIGIIQISQQSEGQPRVYLSVPAKYNHLAFKRIQRLSRYHNGQITNELLNATLLKRHILSYNRKIKGGVSGNNQRITPYKMIIMKIKSYMYHQEWVSINDIVKNVSTYYASPKPSIAQTLRSQWNSNWVETKKINRKVFYRMKHKETFDYGQTQYDLSKFNDQS